MSRARSELIVPGSFTGPMTPIVVPGDTPKPAYDFYARGSQAQRAPLGTASTTASGPGQFFSETWLRDFYLRNKVTLDQALAKQKEVERSRFANTWGGVAIRAGGHFVLAGRSTYAGRLWNLADNDRWCNFSSSVKTFGLSLGGGTEVGLIFFLNTRSLHRIEGMGFGNGSEFCKDVPGKQLSVLVKALKGIERIVDAASILQDIQDLAENLQKFVRGKEPMIVYRNIGGASAEAGWKYGIQGKIDIHAVQGKHSYLEEL